MVHLHRRFVLMLKEALFWTSGSDDSVICNLCPRNCHIKNGKRGFCNVRENQGGILYTFVYGHPAALQVDPIEKKPFAEFMPGTSSFSIGTYGCNLYCLFCQNYHLARGFPKAEDLGQYVSPEAIIELSHKHNCSSVALTYNEPTIYCEYAIDIAKLAQKNNLATVLVTNGYISREAAEVLYPLIDAANVDMKGFSEEFYTEMTSSHLQPVLDSIKYLHDLNKHIELTNLIIPNKNDSDELINLYLDWIEKNLDKQVPLHFSAFFPTFEYTKSISTPRETLYHIRELANNRGFKHVYLGNI